jgi:uncharacterized protein YcaQ
MTLDAISMATARRFILGKQGLWPGRRWAGLEGTAAALRAIEALQMDPLTVVARSHDIALWGRVVDYRPDHLDLLLYHERAFFDCGGGLFIYPMAELPYWRLPMRHKCLEPRWARFAAEHQAVLEQVRAELRARGPLGNRAFRGNAQVSSYRGRKDTALACYYLWLIGELMIHHREGFERVYDFRERIAPPLLDAVAPEDEAERFFARKALSFYGLLSERRCRNAFAGYIERSVPREEARRWLDALTRERVLAPLTIQGSRERWVVLADDLPLLATLEAGGIPAEWQPCVTAGTEEAVFLAPLDIVSARGRSTWLFDFDYVWEVYKPASARRWGYYTLPILYGDRLVGRLDPRLDRRAGTLVLNGFWLEEHAPSDDPAFAAALARGLERFATFLEARRVDISVVKPSELRAALQAAIRQALDVRAEVGPR